MCVVCASRYEFLTDGNDIRFGITDETGSSTVDIVPFSRVDSHVVPEDGTVTCERAGTCECISVDDQEGFTMQMHYITSSNCVLLGDKMIKRKYQHGL